MCRRASPPKAGRALGESSDSGELSAGTAEGDKTIDVCMSQARKLIPTGKGKETTNPEGKSPLLLAPAVPPAVFVFFLKNKDG